MRVKGLAQGPKSCADPIVATPGIEPPTLRVPAMYVKHQFLRIVAILRSRGTECSDRMAVYGMAAFLPTADYKVTPQHSWFLVRPNGAMASEGLLQNNLSRLQQT